MINSRYWYRIQNLPIECTRKQLEKRLRNSKSLAPVQESHKIHIESLAVNDRRNPKTKVAIVSLSALELGRKEKPSQNQNSSCETQDPIRLDSDFVGLTPLCGLVECPKSRTEVDVILVHGLGGHAVDSYLYREDDHTYFWPLERLSTSIPSAQVWLWGYYSKVVGSTSFQNLDDLANSFADCLCADEGPYQQGRACVLIGTSLGGLIIKSAITILKKRKEYDVLHRIAHLIMFGVPSQGMDINNLRKIVGEQSNEPLIRSLDQSSQVLSYLRDNFAQAFPYTDSKIYSFYETEKSKELQNVDGRLEPTNDPPVRLVTKESATHGRWQSESGDEYVRPINKDNRNITTFSESDPYLDNVMLVLRKCCRNASTIVQNRFVVRGMQQQARRGSNGPWLTSSSHPLIDGAEPPRYVRAPNFTDSFESRSNISHADPGFIEEVL